MFRGFFIFIEHTSTFYPKSPSGPLSSFCFSQASFKPDFNHIGTPMLNHFDSNVDTVIIQNACHVLMNFLGKNEYLATNGMNKSETSPY